MCVNNGHQRDRARGYFFSAPASGALGTRLWATRNRLATKAVSVSVALPAGFRPDTWKSLNAADWLTKISPTRLHDTAAPASAARRSAVAKTLGSVE